MNFVGEAMYPLSAFAWDTIITHKNIFRSRQDPILPPRSLPPLLPPPPGRILPFIEVSWRDVKMFLWVIMISHAKALRGYKVSPKNSFIGFIIWILSIFVVIFCNIMEF